MRVQTKNLGPIILCGALFAIYGCSSTPDDMPEVGTVTGVVTLDGKPLEQAQVSFSPENGRTSTGTTDASGTYELTYTPTVQGAKIGKHSVRISTFQEPEGDLDNEEKLKGGREELVPEKYNKQTTLTADVKAGENTFDFELKSE